MEAVRPQVMFLERPIAIPGMPTKEAPIAYLSSHMISFSYQKAGTVAAKCGSVESIGRPDSVCSPEMTQLLEAMVLPIIV